MLFVNELISYKNGEANNLIERILWIDGSSTLVCTIDINSAKALPEIKRFKDIIEGLNNGEISVEGKDPYFRLIDEEQITTKDKEIRDKAWNIISEMTLPENEPDIYFKSKRARFIDKALEENKVSKVMIYKYLRRFWQRGKNKNTLLPDYFNSGGRGKEKKLTDKKVGRPRKEGTGRNADEEMKKIFRIAINNFYRTSKGNNLSTAYELMIKNYYSESYRIQNGIRIPVLVEDDLLPSFTQFKYWHEKNLNMRKDISARKGEKKFELEHRAILGKSDINNLGPGSKYQIDATIGDIYLVSRFNRDWIIGRPVIYAVIDVFSRMVTGLYVGLEGPSWFGAMMALYNATTSKVKFCSEYGIEITQEDWPCCHIPEAILGDRGEMESKSVSNLINGLQVRIDNTPPYRADWKGIVEQYFHTINEYVKPLVPGSIDVDFRQRGGKDYRLDAKLDLYQFTKIMIMAALAHNNEHTLNYYSRSEAMIINDIEPIPARLWNWGIKNCSGKLRTFSEEIIKLNLMPSDKALVTMKGIKFRNLYYSCETAIKRGWFELARNRASWSIIVSYDERNMNNIYIRAEDGRSFEICSLLPSQERFFDKSLSEIEYLLSYENLMKNRNKRRELQTKVDLIAEIESIVNDAEKMTNAAQNTNISKAQKVKNIRVNRKIEKEVNRQSEAFILDDSIEKKGNEAYQKTFDDTEEYIDNDLELLVKLQKERLNGKWNK